MTNAPRVAVVSSRRPRMIAPNDRWLHVLRGAMRQIALDGATLMVGDGTAGSGIIHRAADRLRIPVQMARTSDAQSDVASPRDWNLISQADLVYVLSLRCEGNIHRVLREQLQQAKRRVVLIDADDLFSTTAVRELRELGAETWQPPTDLCAPFESDNAQGGFHKRRDGHRDEVYLISAIPRTEDWIYLTHTTRACPGPWPDETFETYADSLLESRPDADHSTLGTLRRIVSQRRLIAANKTIRGGQSVISLTECPLNEIPSLHRYRTHRVRWDFEPYGICIRADWLRARGTKRVQYGDETLWNSLVDADRPFFQVAQGQSQIDWTVEREWRHVGDLDLSDLTADDVLLFVPDFEAAKSLAELTDWPITLWPNQTNS